MSDLVTKIKNLTEKDFQNRIFPHYQDVKDKVLDLVLEEISLFEHNIYFFKKLLENIGCSDKFSEDEKDLQLHILERLENIFKTKFGECEK